MENIKVREISGVEEKSTQEIENNLLAQHEEKINEETHNPVVDMTSANASQVASESPQEPEEPEAQETLSDLKEEDVLSYIKNRYNKQIDSVDELFEARAESEELPEDVAAYLNYKKETGRGINDFLKINRDLENVPSDQILRDYLVSTEKGLDSEDIDTLMEGYEYDEDIDEESVVKKTRLAKKKAISKAKDYFESEKEKYKLPLESGGGSLSKEDQENLSAYREYVTQSATYDEQMKERQALFQQESDKLFNQEFKGFEFTVGEDNVLTYAPGDATELKNNPKNFVSKFTNDSGILTDTVGYHKSLAIAMNPDKFAKFCYEQGKSAQADDSMRKMKNIDMSSTRNTPEVTKQGGMQVKAMSPDSGRGLKIRSRRK